MAWFWARKPANVEAEAASVGESRNVHETPTREFAAYVPPDESSVHTKPTREFEVHHDPSGAADGQSDSSSLVEAHSGPVRVGPSHDDDARNQAVTVRPPPTEHRRAPDSPGASSGGLPPPSALALQRARSRSAG